MGGKDQQQHGFDIFISFVDGTCGLFRICVCVQESYDTRSSIALRHHHGVHKLRPYSSRNLLSARYLVFLPVEPHLVRRRLIQRPLGQLGHDLLHNLSG